MKKRYLVLAILLGTVTAQAASEKPALSNASTELPDNLSPAFPRKAVDHVVTYEAWRGWGPKGGDRIVLFRRDGMVRTEIDYIGSKRAGEDAQTTEFSNLDTVASLRLVQDGNGSLSSVGISRGNAPTYRHTIARTDGTETIAGESCTVWQAKPEREDGASQTACITRDGVVLRETVLYRSGSVMNERRAIKVERRVVRLEEVLPPVTALTWALWAAQAGAAPTANDGAGNYELKLTGKQEGAPVAKVIRKARGWYSEEDQTESTLRTLLIFGPAVTLSYYNRNHPMLSIGRNKKLSFLTDPRDLKSARLDKPPETVINESCTWYNAAVNVMDYGRLECRTRDQLPLIRNAYSRGHLGESWTATKLSRGQMSPERIAPPASLMDWNFWGWPQLAKH